MSDPNVTYIGSKSLLASPIQCYRITGSPVDDTNPDSVLHWSYFLVIGESLAYVLDMVPGGDTRTGVLIVKHVSYDPNASFLADVTVEATSNATTNDILELLTSSGRTRYRYSDDGSGCRFWCRTILGDLVDNGHVNSGAIESFDQFITGRNRTKPLVYPLPTRTGTFY